jgi:8-oxo-dGTP pyrophosphatase MutT (NUDIX family)
MKQAIMKPFNILGYWVSWPALFLMVNGSNRSRVLIVSNDSILFTKGWINDGRWSLPGGGIERSEEPKEGAVREIREETGIILEKDRLVPLAERIVGSRGMQFNGHFFLVHLEDRPEVKRRSEIMELAWIKPHLLNHRNTNEDSLLALELAQDRLF